MFVVVDVFQLMMQKNFKLFVMSDLTSNLLNLLGKFFGFFEQYSWIGTITNVVHLENTIIEKTVENLATQLSMQVPLMKVSLTSLILSSLLYYIIYIIFIIFIIITNFNFMNLIYLLLLLLLLSFFFFFSSGTFLFISHIFFTISLQYHYNYYNNSIF